jgi:4-amino-4-deoxy-L-arabinose transferase-like glycosyltransferase
MEIESSNKYYKFSVFAIFLFFVLRVIISSIIELGNDEVYYWLFVKYPAISYFDHPAGMPTLVRLFTLDLFFESELALRTVSIVAVLINGFLIFHILKRLNNSKAGFYGVLLYNSSLYVSIITGVFIMPDGPLSSFWLMSIILFLRWFETQKNYYLLLTGVFIALSIFTKYHSIFLIFGIGAFIIFHNINALKNKYLYFSLLIALVGTLPILYWNWLNDWQSFKFHQGRVGVSNEIRFDLFLIEFAGQIIYNNIIIVILSILSIIKLRKINLGKSQKQILLWTSIPLIISFLIASLFKPTFPHWASPGYYSLIILSALYLNTLTDKIAKRFLIGALSILVISIFIGIGQTNYGLFGSPSEKEKTQLGKNEVTLDLYGWKQANEIFQDFKKTSNIKTKKVVAKKWFTAAHIDYYICQPNNFSLIALGNLTDIHEYKRINQIRGGLLKGEDAWFFSLSRNFINPEIEYNDYFEYIEELGAYPIYRNGDQVQYLYIYILRNYNGKFEY